MSSCKDDYLNTPRDYYSDYGYCSCSCDCLSPTATINTNSVEYHDPTNTHQRVKKYKTIKERNNSNSNSRSRKPLLSKRVSQSVEDLHRNVVYRPEIIELCESMQNLCSTSPRVFRAYNSVSTHDQRILNRMAEKRSDKIVSAENAWLAQKMWQNEKYERELMKWEQQEAYRKALKEKQEMDSRLVQLRFDEMYRQDQRRLQDLKKSLHMKDMLAEERLERIRHQRERLASRQEEETRKFENIIRANGQQELNDELRKLESYHHLIHRMDKADSTRKQYLDVYKRRLQADNYREQALHKENYDEALRYERFKRQQLQDSIGLKDRRIDSFVRERQRVYDETVEKAKLSSSLRELVRRSISPDNYQFSSGGRVLYERPISNLSGISSIKLG